MMLALSMHLSIFWNIFLPFILHCQSQHYDNLLLHM